MRSAHRKMPKKIFFLNTLNSGDNFTRFEK
jgi:hypothetical protein